MAILFPPRYRVSLPFVLPLSLLHPALLSGSPTAGREPKKAEASRIAQKYIKPDRRHKSLGPMWRNYYVTHGWGSGELKRGGRKGDSGDYTKKKNFRGSGAFPRGVPSVKLQLACYSSRFQRAICRSPLSLYYIRLHWMWPFFRCKREFKKISKNHLKKIVIKK